MTTKAWVIIICVSVFFSGLIGYMMRGPARTTALSWGYDEKSDLWNRIRVNEKGEVICSK